MLLKFFIISLFLCVNAHAQNAHDEQADALREKFRALEARIEHLESSESSMTASAADSTANNFELTKIEMRLLLPEPLGASFAGLAPGVSRIYSSHSPFAVGGYAEIYYSNDDSGTKLTSIARFNPYLAWRFSENLVFNSGLSFRDGGSNQGTGATQVEFAFLDILTGNDGGVRIGHVLVPFGLVNYRPEPTLFFMVHRPHPEEVIIPSTWHENGVLGFGKFDRVLIQGGIINGGNAANYESSGWIRGGKQNGSTANAQSAAFVFRSEILTASTDFGISFYYGNSGQQNAKLGDATVMLAALHGEARTERFSIKALYTEGALSDTGKIFAFTGRAIGSRARGGYVIASYDLLPRLAPFARSLIDTPPIPGWRELPVFVAWEYDNPYAEPAEGQPISRDFATSRITVGLNYKPHQQVVLKTDYVYQELGNGIQSRIAEVAVAAVF